MYHLTLTHDERKAIDWIGNRYSNGNDLSNLLSECKIVLPLVFCGNMWEYPADMEFTIPEHIAWQIRDNAESEDGFWPCFAPELAAKMQAFVDSIV